MWVNRSLRSTGLDSISCPLKETAMLEVIDKGSVTESHPVPLLFVHGAWHGAWCWDEHFLDFFADRGYACYARPARTRRKPRQGAAALDKTSVIRRRCRQHGGATTDAAGSGRAFDGWLRYSEIPGTPHRCRVVLVAPVPPTGVRRATLRAPHYAVRQSQRLIETGAAGRHPGTGARPIFSASTPDELVNTYQQRLQDESYRAFLDLLALDLVTTEQVNRVPMLVLGAAHDTIIVPQREIRRTAAVYGTKAEVFPDMGHDMMLEPGWQAVAERIDGWLAAQGL
jgi:pimeloyl-ACP methyl ester carboxylesterase